MMGRRKIINFDSKDRLVEKVGPYLESIELFLKEKDKAIPALLKGLKLADNKIKRKIIMLLGGFAKQEIVRPLYEIMVDQKEDEEIRHFASIQLSVTLPFLKERQPFIDNLLVLLKEPNPEMRMHAAFALGWEGNAQAAIPLIELLYDPDIQVQQTAVNALSNLRDDRIFKLLLERLEHGPLDQKRSILFNLWRFYSKRQEVEAVYLQYLDHKDPDLRFDALVLLGTITLPEAHFAAYCKCLDDENSHIRALTLEQIGEAGPEKVTVFKEKLIQMISDPDPKVKRTAIKMLKKHELI